MLPLPFKNLLYRLVALQIANVITLAWHLPSIDAGLTTGPGDETAVGIGATSHYKKKN